MFDPPPLLHKKRLNFVPLPPHFVYDLIRHDNFRGNFCSNHNLEPIFQKKIVSKPSVIAHTEVAELFLYCQEKVDYKAISPPLQSDFEMSHSKMAKKKLRKSNFF